MAVRTNPPQDASSGAKSHCYNAAMKVITGTVVDGKIDVPPDALREGAQVAVLAPDPDEPIVLSAEDESSLMAAMDSIRRGDFIEGSDLLHELRTRRVT